MRTLYFRSDTSREPREGEESGKGYHFVSRAEMEQDIRAGKYLEHGDYEGSLYGTKVDSIREVMRSGKMCILDVNPTVGESVFKLREVFNCVFPFPNINRSSLESVAKLVFAVRCQKRRR